jgi:hypothetical protein
VTAALCEYAECVDESRVDKVLKAFALFLRETFLTSIRFGVGKIDLGMGDIQIAAKNDRLTLLELFAVGEERGIPVLETQWQTTQIIFRIRRVHRYNKELLELGCDHASLFCAVALQFIRKSESLRELSGKSVDHRDGLVL